ncbi:DUF4352 domain-containing protein [Nocardiopsis eucommiae]|uniref:DUF4352 domain-containing protein n=1 Tax=Nocardiopsis eucommiae TaxID=2831970 RepID=UPI003D7154E6
MSDREPEEGAGERPDQDPVNHHPPEEWRPGDPGDPIEGGPQPPGEPRHEPPPGAAPPHGTPPWGQPPHAPPGGPYPGGALHGGPPPGGVPPGGQPPDGPPGDAWSGGQPSWQRPPGGQPSWQQPPGGPQGPQTGGGPSFGPPPGQPGPYGGGPGQPDPGEYSQGPSGPGSAGYEHAGYAPGYGGYPSEPVNYGAQGGYGHPGGYGPPGAGGYGPPPSKPTPWGKIIGIGCGVLLLLLLALGGCAAVALVLADRNASSGGEPGLEQTEEAPGEDVPSEAELTATATEFEPSSLYVEGEFTSVEVTVTNTGADALDVNPLYFVVVDTEGEEHSPGDAIAMDANELGVQTLDPGQTADGAITVPGEIEAERVLFEPYFTGPVEVPVT